MRSLLPAETLNALFNLLTEALDLREVNRLQFQVQAEYLLAMMTFCAPSFKEEVFASLRQLNIPSSDLTYTSVNAYDTVCLGIIYRSPKFERRQIFQKNLENLINERKNNFS